MELVLSCRNHPDVADGLRYCSRCGQAFCPDCLVTIRGTSYCATCKREQLLALSSGVDRNVLELAGIGRRFGALFLDGLLLSLPVIVISVLGVAIATSSKDFNPLLIQPAMLGVIALYVVYEALMVGSRGQTLGKMAMKIKVVR